MKRRTHEFRVLVAVVLCMITVVGCAASGTKETESGTVVTPMEKEASRAVSFDAIGGKDVMPIMSFNGPYASYMSTDGDAFPNYLTDEIFQMIADAGVNVIAYSNLNYSNSSKWVELSLDLCEKFGMGYFVNDGAVTGEAGNDDINVAELSDQIANYADHPAFCGVFLVDEPRTTYYMPGLNGEKDISKYEAISHALSQELGLITYSNMFPVWNLEQVKEKYEQYVAEFMETLNPKTIMWDCYPFYPKKDNDELYVYFYNMDLMRQYSEKYNVPFWAAIQAGSQWNDNKEYFESETPYYPTEGQFYWNVNTCLAFGVQGIDYFPLIQPVHFAYAGSAEEPDWDAERNGLIGVFGNKTIWYNFAKNINRHIAVMDEILMNSVNKGIIITGKQAEEDMKMTTCVLESGKFQELLSVDGEAMVGCFNYQGKTALYVVNYSMEYAQKITLHFNEKHDIKQIQNAETSYVNAKNLELDMAAGEGVLLVLE